MSARRESGRAGEGLVSGPAATQHLVLAESAGTVECTGLVVLRDGAEQFEASRCSGRVMPPHELLIEQRLASGIAADHASCLACAAFLGAIANDMVQFEIMRWLDTDDGARAVKAALQTRRLSPAFDTDFHDVLLHEARRQLSRGVSIRSVPAWSRQYLGWRADKLLNELGMGTGVHRPALEAFVESATGSSIGLCSDIDGDSDPDGRVGPSLSPIEVAVLGELEWKVFDADLLRVLVMNDPAPSRSRSAALTLISMLMDDAKPGDGCPRPGQGVAPVRRPLWAAVWYSGQRDLFGPVGKSDDSRRQQRSRAMRELEELLKKIVERVRGPR